LSAVPPFPRHPAKTAKAPVWRLVVMLLVLGTLWGASFSLAKIAMQGGIEPLGYAFWQALAPGLVLLGVSVAKGQMPHFSMTHGRYYLTAGLLGILIPNIIFYIVIGHIPAGVMAVVVTTAPLLTYVFALGLRMEIFQPLRALGIATGFAGGLVLVLPKASLPAPEMLPWTLLAFLTPCFYAVNSVYSARARPPDSASLGLACGMLFGAAFLQLPLVLALGDFYWPGWPLLARDGALLGQIAISSLAYVLFFELLRLAGPVYFSQVGFIVTLTGLLWGIYFFDERHSAWLYLATLLILFGVAMVNWRGRR